jgi:tetratricopeptide (TPR) repeat protein
MMLRLAVLLLVTGLVACRSLLSPERPPNPPPEPGAAAAPAGAAPPAAAPTPQTPTRQYRLGSAASALVAQAHTRAAAGDYPAAMATLERALRIEPENPLAWIELGRVQLASGNAAQADHMGHKALGLAGGDPNAQAAAWRLIAESLRARGRNEEASTANAHADALVPH